MRENPMRVQPFECMQFFYRRAHDPVIRCRIDFDGCINIDVLREAVDASRAAAPLVFCTFDRDAHMWVDHGYDAGDIVTVTKVGAREPGETRPIGSSGRGAAGPVDASGRGAAGPVDAVGQVAAGTSDVVDAVLMQEPDLNEGPRLRITVVRGTRADTLCLAIDHMVCDGAGFKQYLSLLVGLYSATVRGEDLQRLTAGYPLRRDFRQVTRNLDVGRKLRLLFSRDVHLDPDSTMRLPFENALAAVPPGSEASAVATTALPQPATAASATMRSQPADVPALSQPRLLHVQVGQSQLARIRAQAKRARATFNDVLLAAYARELSRVTGCGDIALPCPVDLRRYGAAGQRFGICNLTANYACHVAIGADDAFSVTLSDVMRQIAAQKASDGCLKAPMLYHAMSHVMSFGQLEKSFFKLAGVPVISYSNLGILDANQLGFAGLNVMDAYLATAVKHPPSFQLSASTFDGVLTLTSCLCADMHDAQVAKELIDGVAEELEAFAQSTVLSARRVS